MLLNTYTSNTLCLSILFFFFLSCFVSSADDGYNDNEYTKIHTCPEWNEPLDSDGVMLCPDLPVEEIAQCPFEQAKTWVFPTPNQKDKIRRLMYGLKKGRIQDVKICADSLGLRVCRKKIFGEKNKIIDKFLVLVSKADVDNYSGPFIYWREMNATRFVLCVPHNGSDRTFKLTEVFENTKALMMFANGQLKKTSKKHAKCAGNNRTTSDTAHSTDNLAWIVHKEITSDPRVMEIEFHGMNDPGMIITNGFLDYATPDTFLYQFALAVSNAFAESPCNIQNTLTVCAPGTPLREKGYCGIRQAWVQTRDMAGSSNPDCKFGDVFNNRFIGFEQSTQWLQNTKRMITVIKSLENVYGTLENPNPNPPTSASHSPTKSPDRCISSAPTKSPTLKQSQKPTSTSFPTSKSPTTKKPSINPSFSPTRKPSQAPSRSPTKIPTKTPSTISPTPKPIKSPSFIPTRYPTRGPTGKPSPKPTPLPTRYPSKRSVSPSNRPATFSPTITPSSNPTSNTPTTSPTTKCKGLNKKECNKHMYCHWKKIKNSKNGVCVNRL